VGTSAEARMGGMKQALGEVCERRCPAELDSCVWTVEYAWFLARPKLPDIQKSHVWGVGCRSVFNLRSAQAEISIPERVLRINLRFRQGAGPYFSRR